jgi:hypothetical protein
MAAPRVFVSYSHQDKRWVDELLVHLKPYVRSGSLEVWNTAEIASGTDWSDEIKRVLDAADLAVLVISPDFLASDFIAEHELPALLNKHREKGIAVLPIVVEASLWQANPELPQLQFLNDPSRPLASLGPLERKKTYASIAKRILEVSNAIQEKRAEVVDQLHLNRRDATERTLSRTLDKATPGDGTIQFFVSHSKADGDFAELLKLKTERQGYSLWVDSDRLLPGTDWREEIDEAIRKSTALVVVLSPDAKESEYVTYEWAFAWGKGIKVIPIMLRATAIHPRLGTLQYLAFTNRIGRPWTKLFEVLEQATEERKAHPDIRTTSANTAR